MKNKSYSFTTEITPETEVLLSGRHGQPLTMRFTDASSSMSVTMDTESIIRLQAFLSDYLLQEDTVNAAAPAYAPTGRALAVIDGDTLDIVNVFVSDKVVGLDNCEEESYESIAEKVVALTDTQMPSKALFVFFDLFDGSIGRGVLRRIIRACITYQVEYVRTGDVTRSRRMVLKDIEDFTSIDISVISRATQRVLIVTPKGVYTMNSVDTSLDKPSLFDEGAVTTDGSSCSRKAVLCCLRDIVETENAEAPYTDEELVKELSDKGYFLARRTVTKYRNLLGLQTSAARRVRRPSTLEEAA